MAVDATVCGSKERVAIAAKAAFIVAINAGPLPEDDAY